MCLGQADPRVVHCATPVDAPWRKFGMNIWVSDSSLQALASLPPRTPLKRGGVALRVEDLVLTKAERVFERHRLIEENKGQIENSRNQGTNSKKRREEKSAPILCKKEKEQSERQELADGKSKRRKKCT